MSDNRMTLRDVHDQAFPDSGETYPSEPEAFGMLPGTAAWSKQKAAAHIDWSAEMRDCVGEAAVLADRVGTSDSNVGEALSRLCNVLAWLVDENTVLREHVSSLRHENTLLWAGRYAR
jgi:hypothetical protein